MAGSSLSLAATSPPKMDENFMNVRSKMRSWQRSSRCTTSRTTLLSGIHPSTRFFLGPVRKDSEHSAACPRTRRVAAVALQCKQVSPGFEALCMPRSVRRILMSPPKCHFTALPLTLKLSSFFLKAGNQSDTCSQFSAHLRMARGHIVHVPPPHRAHRKTQGWSGDPRVCRGCAHPNMAWH